MKKLEFTNTDKEKPNAVNINQNNVLVRVIKKVMIKIDYFLYNCELMKLAWVLVHDFLLSVYHYSKKVFDDLRINYMALKRLLCFSKITSYIIFDVFDYFFMQGYLILISDNSTLSKNTDWLTKIESCVMILCSVFPLGAFKFNFLWVTKFQLISCMFEGEN